jgi:hypothetical protein
VLLVFLGVFVLIVGVLLLVAVSRKAGAANFSSKNAESTYEALPTLLTAAERSFFGVLQQVVPPNLSLFAKVRLADLVQPRSGLNASMRQSALNKICSKHVDFVLCDAATTKVVCVIELDDSSHHRSSRQARDSFVDAALQFAAIPIVRINALHGYAPANIRSELAKVGALTVKEIAHRNGKPEPAVSKYTPPIKRSA